LSVDDNGASLTVDNAALSVTGGGVEASALRVTIASDSTGVVSVDDNGASLTIDNAALNAGSNSALKVEGCTAHDGTDAGNPIALGAQALAHGTNPTAVASTDRTRLYANRAGVLFTIGGHPNVQTLKHANITTAVTDTAIITVGAGSKIVVTRLTCSLDNASTVFPTVLIGFGATTTPTTTGVLFSHGGYPAGGANTIGDGSGIIGIGADNEDLRITTTGNATGNGLQITVSYYTIES
jgi:hypothetical protein